MMENKHFLIILIATSSHSLFSFLPNVDLPSLPAQQAGPSDVSGKKLYLKIHEKTSQSTEYVLKEKVLFRMILLR